MPVKNCYDCQHHHVCTFWQSFDNHIFLFDWDHPEVKELKTTIGEVAAKFCHHFKEREES